MCADIITARADGVRAVAQVESFGAVDRAPVRQGPAEPIQWITEHCDCGYMIGYVGWQRSDKTECTAFGSA